MKTSRSNAEHYTWGEVCDGWLLVNESDRSIIEERMPPGSREVRHYHERASQFLFVLKGALTMEIDGEIVILDRHVGVTISPGTPHQARNESAEDVDFLVISTPTTRGDRTLAEGP